MNMRFAPLASIILATAMAGCTAGGNAEAPPSSAAAAAPQSPVSYADGARAVGAPQDCVQIPSIRESRVRDDRTIDFRMANGRWLRNSLPNNCPQLGFERAFSYSTSLSQLCSVDIISVIVQGAGPRRGASCGLGTFQPIELPKENRATP